MISRNIQHNWQGLACPAAAEIGVTGRYCGGELLRVHKGLREFITKAAGNVNRRPLRQSSAAAFVAYFPFPLAAKKLESAIIKIQKRGFAVCVKQPFFLRQPPLWPLLAVLTTQIRQPITLLCAPSVARRRVPLLPVQQVAAKPKARLLARLLVLVRATFLARQAAATNTGPKTGLITSRHCDDTISARPFGVIPRMAFLLFRAPVRASEKGLLCLKRS